MTFGRFFKDSRIELGLTLRGFCRKYGFDPGNISRLERGRASASKKQSTLDWYAWCLELEGVKKEEFMILAAVSAGMIPEPLTDKELAAKLPLLLEIGRASKEDLEHFAEWLRERM